jgi:hypothetical protein
MPTAPFRLNRSRLLLTLISAAFAGEAGAVAARAEFIVGNVTVSGADGQARPLARGNELDTGDTVRTTDGRAQLRFTDGAYVSLQPNTEFAIKEYRFQGKTDGSERGFFSLVKGAMRTVTGLVGRSNRNSYRIVTPTATIGIRGTGGVIQVLNDGATLVIGTSGIWSLTNPAGSVDVPAGVSALSPATPDQPPQQTSEQPQSGPTPLPPPLFVQGEERGAGGAALLFPPLVTGPGYTAASASSVAGTASIDGGEGSFATFNAAGQMTAITSTFIFNTGSFTLEPGGTHADFGSDGILAWGRWIGPVTISRFTSPTTIDYGPNDGFHYVVGMPTAVMPTIGTATYSLSGATSPTYAGGLTSPGHVTSGTLSVDFGAFSVQIINLGVAMPDASYLVNGNGFVSGNRFSFFTNTVTGGTACGACSCSSSGNGFFAGASAERAGLAYQISDFSKQINGVAAFQKTP